MKTRDAAAKTAQLVSIAEDPTTLAFLESKRSFIVDLADSWNAYTVETADEAGDVERTLKKIRATEKEVQEAEDSVGRPLLEAQRQNRARFKPLRDGLQKLRVSATKLLNDYEAREEKKRREEEQKRRLKAQKEQEKLQARAERRAEKLREKGKEEAAQETLDAVPVVTAPVIEAPAKPRTEGISKRDRWKFRLKNESRQKELLRSAIDAFNATRKDGEPRVLPAEYWGINEKAIAAVVRSTKGEVKLPDVETYNDPVRAVSV